MLTGRPNAVGTLSECRGLFRVWHAVSRGERDRKGTNPSLEKTGVSKLWNSTLPCTMVIKAYSFVCVCPCSNLWCVCVCVCLCVSWQGVGVMIFRISQGVVRKPTEGSPGRVLNFDYVYSFIQSSHCSIADIWSIVQSSSDQNTPDSRLHRIPLVWLSKDVLKQDIKWKRLE